MPTRTATPNRKSTTKAPSSTRKAKGVVDRTSGRSSPVVSMRSPSNKALTVTRRLLCLDNGSPKIWYSEISRAPNVTQLTQDCPLWVISGHCGISEKCLLYPRADIAERDLPQHYGSGFGGDGKRMKCAATQSHRPFRRS